MGLLSTAQELLADGQKRLSVALGSVFIPLVAAVPGGDDALGDFAYEAGTGGDTVSVPADALCLEISGYANGGDGTITIDGGDSITVRSGGAMTVQVNKNGGFDIVFSETMDYYVSWRA